MGTKRRPAKKAAKAKPAKAKAAAKAKAGPTRKAKPAAKTKAVARKGVVKAKPRKPAPRPSAPSTPPDADFGFDLDAAAFVSDDATKAYEHFRAILLAEGGDVAVANGASSVVRGNVQQAFHQIAPHLSEIPQLVPSVSVNRLMELPTLALALVHAESLIPSASRSDIEAALARVTDPRELTLSYLEIAAKLGLVDAVRVREIRAGSGKLDKARDCVDIAGVFADYEHALAGKHPFSAHYLEEMRATGAFLVQVLTPSGAAKDRTARPPEADVRDRIFQAIRARYDDLEKAAVQLWGLREAVDRVPAMLAHERGRSVPPPPPPPPRS
jgi:hypothetical protein